ncbi:hypothetical protein ANOM_006580 [Aspergillus nomiae NRRL 13137]|uniref:Xylanolytic transcriptional activator regulatory domain-containing protein n=1 Tax=Aspergillus nomiae NRRL (strain ATCC 15546 / NRRL 13137 / CBS 260.88 / M93) TaxID=1509407 RepID=A0A0L1J334_ASPN3|nr:uncharacterized protein ANOM_006580 [Aspergillus nomiae NRRL 13137]KNG86164.1 hypothetical protein ANOM_006580 [Aspergillus nomiae NRRL 13137]
MPPAESPLQQKDAVLALLPPTALVRLRNTAQATPPAQEQELRNGTHEFPTNQDILDRLIKVEGLISDLKASFDHGKASPAPIEHDQDAPGPVLVPPAQPPEEAPMGEGVRGSYVDNSVFVKLFLDDTSRQTSGSAKLPNSSSGLSIHRPSMQYGIVATDVFGYQVDDISIPSQTYGKLWSLYKQNFDPLVKLLHIPTIQPVILHASANPHEADDTTMTLVYAVAFAATATVPRARSIEQLGFEKTLLLRHLMQQMDSAFMRAQFLLRPSTWGLTALVIYLTALRTHDATRTIWILTGLAMRIAESLGVHVNGTRLGLDPFETEIRRRLWWHLTALDATAPESHGFNSTTVDRNHTCLLPTNIDDVDISPQMTEPPIEKDHWTELSFSIMNLDLCRSLRRAIATTTHNDAGTRVDTIYETERKVEQQWLRLADMTNPLCRAADALLRISVLKTRFIMTLQTWLSTTKSTDCRYNHLPQSVFTTAIKLLEDGYLLQSGKLFESFAWFYQQQPQLYALFLVLRTLHASPGRAEADRAWVAVDNYFTCLTDFEEASEMKGRTSCVWTVLGPLRDKARESSAQMSREAQGLVAGQASSTLSPAHLRQTGSPDESGPPLSATEINMQLSPFHATLEPSALHDMLVWQDFSDLINLDARMF